MADRTVERAGLPKAPPLKVGLSHGKWMLARFRLANSHQLFLGPFTISIRAPWLEGPARQLHPHLFEPEYRKKSWFGDEEWRS